MDALDKKREFLKNDLPNIYIVYGVVVTAIGFFGVVGNILASIVLYRRKMNSNTALLFWLGIWDIVTIIGLTGVVGSSTIFKIFFKDKSGSVDADRIIDFTLLCLFLGETGNFIILSLKT